MNNIENSSWIEQTKFNSYTLPTFTKKIFSSFQIFMKKIAIIGAGISGLFFANLLRQDSNYEITIYEKNNSINLEKGYGIQLSVNSIKFLNKIGFKI